MNVTKVSAVRPVLALLNEGFIGSAAVRLVLGSDELGGCGDEAERETRRILSGPRQFGPSVHSEPQLQVTRSHTSHTHGALSR